MRCLARALPIVALWVQQVAGKYDEELCDEGSYSSPGTDLTYVPNAWNPDGDGFQCIAIRDSPPAIDATWRWSKDPGSVHSYPHVKLTDPALPVPLSNISALTLAAQWAMGPGSTPQPVPSIDLSGMTDLDVSSNAAFDLFADRNAANSGKETSAETEIMIWLGKVGHAEPLGYDGSDKCCAKVTVGHVEFTLYQGKNQRGTAVFTWLANTDETSFAGDISPLLQHLWRNGLVSAGSYLGLVGFGSEAYHSEKNVTFSASGYAIDVLTGPAPTLLLGQLPTGCPPEPEPKSDSKSESESESESESGIGRLHEPWLFCLSISGIVGALVYLW